jgi:hypothetical protein
MRDGLAEPRLSFSWRRSPNAKATSSPSIASATMNETVIRSEPNGIGRAPEDAGTPVMSIDAKSNSVSTTSTQNVILK